MVPQRFIWYMLLLNTFFQHVEAFTAVAGAFSTSSSAIRNLPSPPSPSSGLDGTSSKIVGFTRLYSAPAVMEPPVKEKEKVEDKENIEERQNYSKKGGWAVRLFNDPMNKREFVAMCLSKIVGLSDGQAYQVMMQAHQNGVSVVGRFDFERAETYKTALVDNGLTCDMIEVED